MTTRKVALIPRAAPDGAFRIKPHKKFQTQDNVTFDRSIGYEGQPRILLRNLPISFGAARVRLRNASSLFKI
jgi:hypothetical protein